MFWQSASYTMWRRVVVLEKRAKSIFYSTLKMEVSSSSETSLNYYRLQSVTLQRTLIFTVTDVRTSNFSWSEVFLVYNTLSSSFKHTHPKTYTFSHIHYLAWKRKKNSGTYETLFNHSSPLPLWSAPSTPYQFSLVAVFINLITLFCRNCVSYCLFWREWLLWVHVSLFPERNYGLVAKQERQQSIHSL